MQHPTNLSEEEALSVLMDGEWSEVSSAGSISAICSDKALRDKWARYHIIRDSLKGEAVHADQALASRICSAIADEPAHSNVCAFGTGENKAEHAFSAGSQQIVNADSDPTSSDEQALSANADTSASAQMPSWLNTGLVGLSLAASVALVTVVGLNIFEEQGNAPSGSSIAFSTDGAELQNQTVAESGTDLRTLHVPQVDLVSNTGAFWISPESSTRVVDEGRLNMLLSRHIENSPTAVREGFLPYSRIVGSKEADQ